MTFIPNPSFDAQLERILFRALDAAGETMATDVKRLASWSSTIPAATRSSPPFRTALGLGVRVVIGRDGFKTNFFEDGTKSRRTRSGANRGAVAARPHKEPALEAAVRRGLDIGRYL